MAPPRLDPGRKREVPGDFDLVADRYDLLTSKNPGYQAHLGLSARRLGLAAPGTGLRLLDLCCGTGLSTAGLLDAYPDAEVVGVDASAGMLAEAESKDWGGARVSFVLGDAMDLPAAGAAGPWDGILMAYGLRNVPDPDRCLAGLLATLRPGAPLCVHDYSLADTRARATWSAVAWTIIIPGGLVTSRHTRIYRYLWRSVLEWDRPDALVGRLERAGLTHVVRHDVDGWQRGIVHSFVGRRPPATDPPTG